jgi:hypothetical protein
MGEGQQPEDRQHDFGDSYCRNVVELLASDNLEWFTYLTRQQILRTASRKATDRGARWRRERARLGGLRR